MVFECDMLLPVISLRNTYVKKIPPSNPLERELPGTLEDILEQLSIEGVSEVTVVSKHGSREKISFKELLKVFGIKKPTKH